MARTHSVALTLFVLGAGLGAAGLGTARLAAQTSGAQNNAFFAGPGTQGAYLHGTALLPGTTVLAGETVTTGPGGVAVLTPTHGAGGVLALGPGATATVATGAVSGIDRLQVQQGSALVTGQVEVSTPQHQVFQPSTETTRYVVDATSAQSSMGVLAGAVQTYAPSAATTTIPAGDAIQITAAGDTTQIQRIPLQQVRQPSAASTVPQQKPASQSN